MTTVYDTPASNRADDRRGADRMKCRSGPQEQVRIADLLSLFPQGGATVLDIGARDGYISRRLADVFEHVVALDLTTPVIHHAQVTCVVGDVTCLPYPDKAFDAALCAELLEHLPSELLPIACAEISRVVKYDVVIGVPYRQDIRLSRTTCPACRKINPPWGHVNTFDEQRLRSLFHSLRAVNFSYVGTTRARTNWLSAKLMDLAGNPFGTYNQEEPCIFCGAELSAPTHRTSVRRVFSRLATLLRRAQESFVKSRPKWVHVRFSKSHHIKVAVSPTRTTEFPA